MAGNAELKAHTDSATRQRLIGRKTLRAQSVAYELAGIGAASDRIGIINRENENPLDHAPATHVSRKEVANEARHPSAGQRPAL